MSFNRTINVQLQDRVNEVTKFSNLMSLIDFIEREINFWDDVKNKSPSSSLFTSVMGNFKKILQDITNENNLAVWSDAELNQNVRYIIQQQDNSLQQRWLSCLHPYSHRVSQILIEYNEQIANGFVSYISGHNLDSIQVKDMFEGYLLAYEYQYQNSDLVKRRSTERATITRLRDQLLEKNDQFITQLDDTQQQYGNWFEQTTSDVDEFYADLKVKLLRRKNAIRKLAYREKQEYRKEFDVQYSIWSERIQELENTYQEKLRLAKPAEYWKSSAKKYRAQGIGLVIVISLLVVVALQTGIDLFQSWLLGGETVLSVKTLPGAVLFASMAAILGFALRALSRLAFSTFHLMRDSEEREQLTYLYLSLSNESAIDKESRDIILQALFCRTETGLLSQDSGPTMPGFGDAMKELTKTK